MKLDLFYVGCSEVSSSEFRGAQDYLRTLGGISASFVKRRGDKGTVPGKGGEMTFLFFFFF